MIDREQDERFHLAKERLMTLQEEEFTNKNWKEYFGQVADLFGQILEILQLVKKDQLKESSLEQLENYNDHLYEGLRGDNYTTSFANPTYARKCFGDEIGNYACYFAAKMRDAITFAFQGNEKGVLRWMETMLFVYSHIIEEDVNPKELKSIIYYDIHDYMEEDIQRSITELLDPSYDFYTKIVLTSDFCQDNYLYYYGENITENELGMRKHLAAMPKEQLRKMAQTYTQGFRDGFIASGIDLTKKKTVNIRYSIGFEPMVCEAIYQFKEMGLEPVIYCRTNCSALGVVTTPANKQYLYDHRYDQGIYLNHAYCQQRLSELRKSFEARKEMASGFAGPAVIEIFGDGLFVPESKKEAVHFTKKQEEIWTKLVSDESLLRNEYMPRDAYSFTIIAYPVPEIGKDFSEIFDRTVEVNTLDKVKYQKIHEKIIDALDQGELVKVTGRGNNKTNLSVCLHTLSDPEKETNFENCLADVNIPLGEVFTSPKLAGTTGVLHVTNVHLNQLKYENLELTFQDGMIKDYNCSNYQSKDENKKYIKENILHHKETLPMGEFAIGTNTTAYQMALDFQISDQLPILIAEKTGPHFAVGDTCYSMSEEVVIRNPDGKEVIARDNECSILRKTDRDKAYFNCHTDITIPYYELGDIVVVTKENTEITIIKEGRFVLEGTQELNQALKGE